MNTRLDLLRAWLASARDGLNRMAEILERESACLSARDAAGMEQAARDKQELAPELDELALQRRELVGDGSAVSAIETFLKTQGATDTERDTLLREWSEVERLIHSCQRKNEINGAYIGLLRRHVNVALDILSGPSEAATYGPDGAKRRGGGARLSYSA